MVSQPSPFRVGFSLKSHHHEHQGLHQTRQSPSWVQGGGGAFHQLQQHRLIIHLVGGGVVVLRFNSLVSLLTSTISGLFEFVEEPP
jgi:hypothetical protein